MRLAFASLFGLSLIAGTVAHAETAATVRVGSHPGFGRVVFDLPDTSPFQVSQRGSRVVITFSAGGTIGMPDAVPRNVVSVLGGEGTATLTIAPGARIRSAQMGSRVVIDVLDPVTRARSAIQLPETPPQSAPAAPLALPVEEPASSAPPGPSQSIPAPAPAEEVKLASAEPATPTPTPSRGGDRLQIPAAGNVGAAAFRRGDLGVVVFDDRVPIDSGQFEAAGFAGSSARVTGTGTMLVVPLAPDGSLSLGRDNTGWFIKAGKTDFAAVDQAPIANGIAFPFAEPGRVMTVRDPFTGQTLLVGTSKSAGSGARSVADARRAPGYVLLPTWLGVAIEPTSDLVVLRASLSGFSLVTPDANSPAKTASAEPESWFGLPNAPVPALMRQLRAEIADAAGLPARARGRDRVAAARTMLALGMASEAQGLLSLASDDDPAVASDPTVAALSGMAAVLAGRPGEAAGLDAPGTDANEEVALWRGLRSAAQGKPADAIGRAVEIAMEYPAAVRDRILPPIVEAAVREGHSPFADERVSKLPGLDYARALQAEREGKVEQALTAYDALDKGRNASDSVRAAAAAAELRLAKGQIAPAEAAEVLDRQTLRWRGDGRELATRLRMAELRVQASQWRAALDSLRETESLFPNAKAEIDARKASVLRALAASDTSKVGALELVALTGDYADSLPEGSEGDAIAALLAQKLMDLDLPSRAAPLLQRLLAGAKSGRAKAEFTLALAQLTLDLGDPAKAETLASGVDIAILPADRVNARGLLLARARAAQGDERTAVGILAGLSSPAADDLRANLAARSGDWAGSLNALNDLAAKLVPRGGELNDDQQNVAFRQAVAAVQAGDSEALRSLRPLEKRMKGPKADQFRVLTASAVRSTDDLPRAAGGAGVRTFVLGAPGTAETTLIFQPSARGW